jgi:hypothetical protein
VTLETLIKRACEDWSTEARVPPGLADRALRRQARRRSFTIALAAGSTALLVGAASVVFAMNQPTPHSSAPVVPPAKLSPDTSVRADLTSKFPRRLVAAGNIAVSAYFTGRMRSPDTNDQTFERTWHLINPLSERYEKTSWAFLDVASGLEQAAVLEGPLPTSRVGILDLKTQLVTRWIEVENRVGGVSWAPDGRRLVLTTYAENPDRTSVPSTRTGFYIVDAAGEPGPFQALAADVDNGNYRQDFEWSRSGTLIWSPTTSADPSKHFYDLQGRPRPAPANEDFHWDEAGLSPDGTMMTKFGPSPGPAVTITNVKTGEKVAVLPIQQARAWADNKQLFAIGCDPKACTGRGEFRNRLLLVSLDGKITPLTGYRKSDQPGTWYPVYTRR